VGTNVRLMTELSQSKDANRELEEEKAEVSVSFGFMGRVAD
jgi:hypothetical protein